MVTITSQRAARMPHKRGIFLAVIPHQFNAAHPRILSGQRFDHIPAMIGTAVVDKQNLKFLSHRQAIQLQGAPPTVQAYVPRGRRESPQSNSWKRFYHAIEAAYTRTPAFQTRIKAERRVLPAIRESEPPPLFSLPFPIERFAQSVCNFLNRFMRQAAKHRQHGSPHQKIIQVNYFFILGDETDLAAAVGRQVI
jgi:hypothetical protein